MTQRRPYHSQKARREEQRYKIYRDLLATQRRQVQLSDGFWIVDGNGRKLEKIN